ncbi:MAG: hypothetical protein AB1424_05265 [Thermodesulfobacteriota bacterium]
MLGKILINGLVLLGLLLTPAKAQELLPSGAQVLLPAGVVNTALENFGNILSGADYGQGNVTPVEVVGQGERREIRIFRTPELRLARHKKANMQVLLGNVKSVYVWVEAPPERVNFHLTVDLLYLDGTRRTLYNKDMHPGVKSFVMVEPHVRLECQIATTTKIVKLNRRFILTVSPLDIWATWPELLPIPYRTFFE